MLYLQYWDVNHIYGRAMSQTLPTNDFKWVEDNSEFNDDFKKSYNDESDEGYFLEVDVQYSENLRNLQNNDWSFLPEWIKIEKVEKLIAILRDKTEYIIHIRYLKQALNYGWVLKKVHRIIKFNQKPF